MTATWTIVLWLCVGSQCMLVPLPSIQHEYQLTCVVDYAVNIRPMVPFWAKIRDGGCVQSWAMKPIEGPAK